MTKEEFLYNLTEEYATAEFEYRGKKCGIEPEIKDSITTYTMWYGDKWEDYTNIEALMNDDFFDGESLNDILPELDIWY